MKISPLQPEELQLFRSRVMVLGIIFTLCFSLLASRLWYLQVINGEKYAEFSRGNRIRLIPQAAPRGIIYDRNGVALAENRQAYQLELVREDTPDMKKTLTNLALALDISYYSLAQKVSDQSFKAPFKPIILDEDLDNDKAALIETYQDDFPGVSVTVQSRRFYPHNKVASHVLGYVGILNEKQEESLPLNKRTSGHVIGQAATELLKNDTLIGTDGGKQIEVDHVGRELRILNQPVNPIPGNDVYLTIDLRIQNLIDTIMKGKSGAVVVMRPHTGEILALGSYPSYNPNLFAAGISRKNWNRLMNNPDHPLENKVVQGTYPPGSVFKMVTAYAGLDTKIIGPNSTYFCNGYFYIKGRSTPYKCWRWQYGGHGTVDLKAAIRGSCNVYFYSVGTELGIDRLHDYAVRFGFGKKIGINWNEEKAGLVPSEAWKRKIYKERWYLGETPPVSIGQGYVNVTPLQQLNFINIIANGGIWVKPHLVMEENETLQPVPLGFSKDYLKWIREGMVSAVNDPGGTAGVVKNPNFLVGGKTGTAQVVSHKTLAGLDSDEKKDKALQNHAWFAAFGPMESPEISVAVLVEHGGAGGRDAGPIAKQVFDYYYENFYRPQHSPEASAVTPASTQTLSTAPLTPFARSLEAAFGPQ